MALKEREKVKPEATEEREAWEGVGGAAVGIGEKWGMKRAIVSNRAAPLAAVEQSGHIVVLNAAHTARREADA